MLVELLRQDCFGLVRKSNDKREKSECAAKTQTILQRTKRVGNSLTAVIHAIHST